jgi:hypothetical protein
MHYFRINDYNLNDIINCSVCLRKENDTRQGMVTKMTFPVTTYQGCLGVIMDHDQNASSQNVRVLNKI